MNPFVVSLIVSLVVSVVSMILMPKPKQAKGAQAQELDSPTASAGSPVPVAYGSIAIKAPNCLWYGDKTKYEFEVKA